MQSLTNENFEVILSRFVIAGISYRHAHVTERSLFAVSSDKCHLILNAAKERGIKSLIILSTCNRTEFCAYSHDKNILIDLIIEFTNGTRDIFDRAGFIKQGAEAINHLFKVASGLDSQITGDFEISGQLKKAVAVSRHHKMIGPMMDRTISFALQASKSVRTNTKLSTGTVSVSFAAIEWLRKIEQIQNKNILVLGTGKFGRTLTRNIKYYFPGLAVTIINRTDDSAMILADFLSYRWQPFSALDVEVKKADIILVCTNAPAYTLLPQFFPGNKKYWILDLSVPENTDPTIKNIPGMTVTGLDEVSTAMK